jgi:hypothetical protein
MQPIQFGGGGGGGGAWGIYSLPIPTTLCCILIDTHIGMIHKDKEKAFLYSVMLSYAH